jgi:lipopolysaccharide biosynthesis glycosyltransferase
VGPLGYMNGGLQVVNPSKEVYDLIIDYMASDKAIDLEFADQSLLSDLFRGRWVPLPYTYNALKTLRWEGVHKEIWRDDKVKNIHYILAPKPWNEMDEQGNFIGKDETHGWWVTANKERLAQEKTKAIKADGF